MTQHETGDTRRVGSQSDGLAFRHVVIVALWFGLITGVGTVGLLALKNFGLGLPTIVTPQVVWIAPLTFALLALPVGLVLGLLGGVAPRFFGARTIVFLLSGAGALCGLMTWGKELTEVSVIVLSLGIAVQFAHLAKRRPALFRRAVRSTFPVLLALPILGAVVLNVGGVLRERHLTSRLPDPSAGAPNVLFIILDTVRAISTGLTEHSRPTTPNLDAFGERGIVFEYAFSPTSWTLPSHASMFTGRHVDELSTSWAAGLDRTWPTLAEYLSGQGYRTGGVVGNYFYGNSEWGLDRGFVHYMDHDLSLGQALVSTFVGTRLIGVLRSAGLHERFGYHHLTGRGTAPEMRKHLVRWLDQDPDRPWFGFVNFYDAHDPYVAPDEFVERISMSPRDVDIPVKVLEEGRLIDTSDEHRQILLADLNDYEAAILYLDDQIGRLLDDLDDRGLLENTLVVITSDHGEEFGENGRNWHGESVYSPSIHVPLIVRLPDERRPGERVSQAVGLADLPATILDVLGLSADSPFPGQSLVSQSLPTSASRPVRAEVTLDDRGVIRGADRYWSLLDDQLHYIRSSEDREELYRYREDPFEQSDLTLNDLGLALHYRESLDSIMGAGR